MRPTRGCARATTSPPPPPPPPPAAAIADSGEPLPLCPSAATRRLLHLLLVILALAVPADGEAALKGRRPEAPPAVVRVEIGDEAAALREALARQHGALADLQAELDAERARPRAPPARP